MFDRDTLTTLLDQLATKVQTMPNGEPLIVVPDGSKVEDLSRFMPAPSYTKAKAVFNDVDSFIAYVADQGDNETRIFAKPFTYQTDMALHVQAVIDHPTHGSPRHGTHTATLMLAHSVQLKRWAGVFEKWIPQIALAEFIEENMLDIQHPTAADLTEMVRDFRVMKTGSFRSMKSLHNGDAAFSYVEETKPQQDLVIPSKFQIDIPIFFNEPPVKLAVHLRYDVDDGKLKFKLVPHRIVFEIDAQAKGILARISEAATKPVLLGSTAIG